MGIIGALIGLFLGGGLFWLRRQAWPVANALGIAALSLAGLGLVGGMVLVYRAGRTGGDGVMAAAAGLFVMGVATSSAFVLSLVTGIVQGLAVGQPIWKVIRSMLLDFLALGMILIAYHRSIFEPGQSAVTNEWWQKELARREGTKKTRDAVPSQYQGITVEMLDSHQRARAEVAEKGVNMPPMVPQEVENAIRNTQLVPPAPPIPDKAGYERTQQQRSAFQWGLGVAWCAGAFVLPLGLLITKRTIRANPDEGAES